MKTWHIVAGIFGLGIIGYAVTRKRADGTTLLSSFDNQSGTPGIEPTPEANAYVPEDQRTASDPIKHVFDQVIKEPMYEPVKTYVEPVELIQPVRGPVIETVKEYSERFIPTSSTPAAPVPYGEEYVPEPSSNLVQPQKYYQSGEPVVGFVSPLAPAISLSTNRQPTTKDIVLSYDRDTIPYID